MEGFDMATSTYTCRAFASGASLAALATPVVAFPTLAAVNASPDHELLVLGAQLRRATVLMNETMDVFEAIWEPIEERAWASVGGHIVDVMPDRRMGDAEARAYYDRFSAENARLTALAEPEYSFKKAAADAAAHDFDRINGEILKTPATTIEGVAVKTAAYRWWRPGIFTRAKDVLTFEDHLCRQIIEEVERIAAA
jgi:hypothetical protein